MHSYDLNGNLATKTEGSDTWVYTWNAENQLTKVQKNGVEVARFSYDPLGRRVEKDAGGVATTWTYDAVAILRETSPSATYKYIQGPTIDEPLAREDASGTRTYYHADGLGSIVKMTDATGAVVLTRQYDTWGNLEVGADQPGYAFTGREWDAETGLYYYRARYYDPKVGRFISEDPIGFRGQDVSLYRYVWNRPGALVDPFGWLGNPGPIPQPPPTPTPPPPTPKPTPTPKPKPTPKSGTLPDRWWCEEHCRSETYIFGESMIECFETHCALGGPAGEESHPPHVHPPAPPQPPGPPRLEQAPSWAQP